MPSKKQRKGYESNALARQFLLSKGYTYVWFKSHQRHQERVFVNSSGTFFMSTDIWGLFDGICFDKSGVPVFLQIKTNSWKGWNAIKSFSLGKLISVLFLNVRKGKVEVRRV